MNSKFGGLNNELSIISYRFTMNMTFTHSLIYSYTLPLFYAKQTQFQTQHTYAHTAKRSTSHGPQVTINAKQTQFHNHRTYAQSHSTGHGPRAEFTRRSCGGNKYAKRTQFAKNNHKCLRHMGLHKYPQPAMLVSKNNQSSIITNQLKGEPNFSRRDTKNEIRKNAKRTQFYSQAADQTRKRYKFYSQKVSISHQLLHTFTHLFDESAHFSSFFATFAHKHTYVLTQQRLT
jgi:hypothetical protein